MNDNTNLIPLRLEPLMAKIKKDDEERLKNLWDRRTPDYEESYRKGAEARRNHGFLPQGQPRLSVCPWGVASISWWDWGFEEEGKRAKESPDGKAD